MTSDAAGGRSAEESEAAKGERLRDEDFVSRALRDDQRGCDEQQDRRDEDDGRHQHREQNRGGDQEDDDAALHRLYGGEDNGLETRQRASW
jgi:hypothetical protein